MKSKTPTVSVIVPVYKAEKYLRKCLDSLLAQTFKDFELLLIDDGSPDKSGAICDEYARRDTRIHVFHKKNGGVSSARNMGLDHAQGEWIAFVDADDWVDKSFLDVLGETPHLNHIDIIHFGVQMENTNGNVTKQYDFSANRLIPTEELFKKGVFSSCTFTYFFKASLIGEIRFNEHLRYSEDREFIIKMILSTKHAILLADNTAYFYAYHPTSATHTPRTSVNSLDDLVALNHICQHIRQNRITVDENSLHFIQDLFLDSFFYVYSGLPRKLKQTVRKTGLKQIAEINRATPLHEHGITMFQKYPICLMLKYSIYKIVRKVYHSMVR